MSNLQKHPVKPGVYVGKAGGTWHVKRVGKGKVASWRATKASGEKFVCDPPAIAGKTLKDIATALADLDVQIMAEIAGYDQAIARVSVEMSRDVFLPNPFKGVES